MLKTVTQHNQNKPSSPLHPPPPPQHPLRFNLPQNRGKAGKIGKTSLLDQNAIFQIQIWWIEVKKGRKIEKKFYFFYLLILSYNKAK